MEINVRPPRGGLSTNIWYFATPPGGENAFLKFMENTSDISFFLFSFFATVTDATDVTGEMK